MPSLDELYSGVLSGGTPLWVSHPLVMPASTRKKMHQKINTQKHYNRLITNFMSPGSRPDGMIGVEIECEGERLFDAPFAYWHAKQDGSLRPKNGSPPVEYVLRQPMSRTDVEIALKYLEQKLKDSGSSIFSESPRTSVHVHLNCLSLTIRQVYTFICLYMIFEEALVDFCGQDRVGNLFCLRTKDSDFFVDMLCRAIRDGTYRDTFQEEYRYTACNLNSLLKLGSVEFRSMRGTVDVSLILLWVDLLVNLFNRSREYDNPIHVSEDFHKLGPQKFFHKIFQEQRLAEALATPELFGRMWAGVRLMKDVAYSSEWVRPEKPKKAAAKPKQSTEDFDSPHHRPGYNLIYSDEEFEDSFRGDIIEYDGRDREIDFDAVSAPRSFIIDNVDQSIRLMEAGDCFDYVTTHTTEWHIIRKWRREITE